MNEVSIENLLNEYDKCVMSKLINKEYKFEELKKIVKTFSEQTGFIKYSDEMKENEYTRIYKSNTLWSKSWRNIKKELL